MRSGRWQVRSDVQTMATLQPLFLQLSPSVTVAASPLVVAAGRAATAWGAR